MSQDLIKRYRKSLLLRFPIDGIEDQFRAAQNSSGRGAAVFSFALLFILNLAFGYLEYRAFGRDTLIPLYGYLIAASLAFINLALTQITPKSYWRGWRLLINGLISIGTVMVAVKLQKYSAYHAIEIVLLLIWLVTMNTGRFQLTTLLSLIVSGLFLGVMYFSGVSSFWILLVGVLLVCAVMVASYLSYQYERHQRLLFLQTYYTDSLSSRQETWAFTLIDLDAALNGVVNFKELVGLLKKYLEPVIEFESYILTTITGQGPKLAAEKMGGDLFENDDKTLWSEDLLGKLTQTRQATTSAEHEEVKGLFGMKKQRFLSFRLDVPIFNDSNMIGVISLRRVNKAFDDLDKIASVSLATQAMLIFKRTAMNSGMVVDNSIPDPVIPPKPEPSPRPRLQTSSGAKLSSTTSTDMEVTDHNFNDPDEMVAPPELITRIKLEEEAAKKTITLLSRENADKIAMDKYRTAAVEGEPLSILIAEVDGLSKLREQDGDQIAYKVFAAIVKYIFSKIDKDKDILGRYGQNGLSILLPQIDMNAAEKFAESIRDFVSRARYKTSYGEKSATLSIGVAAMTDDTGDYSSMVKRADMALFVAKKNGRNCVKVRL